ncbi:hypothetical protein BDN71DRAFT_1436995 [Pleurotus eryngii]|uniref:Uncharacterized protein n=1 Tax=Pleurotus eryngii TaxID=5323 RepID=A0A9P5ZGE4_PLEER|nr:hypothetical protein BDN71DRAFT_1436995 [Pleurotus eryngii]
MDWSVIPNKQVNWFLPTDYVNGMNEKAEKWKNGQSDNIKINMPSKAENVNMHPTTSSSSKIDHKHNIDVDTRIPANKHVKSAASNDTEHHQERLTDVKEYMCECLQIQQPNEFEYAYIMSAVQAIQALGYRLQEAVSSLHWAWILMTLSNHGFPVLVQLHDIYVCPLEKKDLYMPCSAVATAPRTLYYCHYSYIM